MLPGAAAPGSLPFAHDGFDSARGPCTFAALRTLLHDDLRGVDASTRVAIAMQNGADLALSLLRVAHWAVAVPLDPNAAVAELRVALAGCAACVVDAAAGPAASAAAAVGTAVVVAVPKAGEAGATFHLPGPDAVVADPAADRPCLLLRTSGTTGRPKIVAKTRQQLVAGGEAIARSLALRPSDCCLNFMPLHHIGGIVSNIYSPLVSGSAAVYVKTFSPTDVLNLDSLSPRVTWIYCVPSHLQAILAARTPGATPPRAVRLYRSGAAALPAAVAEELRAWSGAVVLPTYSMTECMPIASPRGSYELDRAGSVGPAIGPELAISERGEVLIRGPLVSHDAKEWFATGDLGRIDPDGWLTLTGRAKEIINRGGEVVSPLEVEDACVRHPRIAACVCFAVPHDALGEAIGLLVVPRGAAPTLAELRSFLEPYLAAARRPQYIFTAPALPVGPTGKPLRAGLAEKFRLPATGDRDAGDVDPVAAAAAVVGAVAGSVAGPDQRLSAAGVDSLGLWILARRLRARRADPGADDDLGAFLRRDPTVRELAAFVGRWEGADAPDASPRACAALRNSRRLRRAARCADAVCYVAALSYWQRLMPAYYVLRSVAIAHRWRTWPALGLGWVLFEACYFVHFAALVAVLTGSRALFAVAFALANGHQPLMAAVYGERPFTTDAFLHLAPAALTWAARWFGACLSSGCRDAPRDRWFWLRAVPACLVSGYVAAYAAAHACVLPRRAITVYRVHAERPAGVLHRLTGVAGDRGRLPVFTMWELLKRNAFLPLAAASYESFALHTACIAGAHGLCLARRAYLDRPGPARQTKTEDAAPVDVSLPRALPGDVM